MPTLKRWLARFSFSLVILCGLLAWTAYKEHRANGLNVRVTLFAAGAVVALAVGMAGMKERHRLILRDYPKDFPDNDRSIR